MSRISTPPLPESGTSREDIDYRDINAHSNLLLVEAEFAWCLTNQPVATQLGIHDPPKNKAEGQINICPSLILAIATSETDAKSDRLYTSAGASAGASTSTSGLKRLQPQCDHSLDANPLHETKAWLAPMNRKESDISHLNVDPCEIDRERRQVHPFLDRKGTFYSKLSTLVSQNPPTNPPGIFRDGFLAPCRSSLEAAYQALHTGPELEVAA
jgi:hypothetical protein